MCDLYLEGIKPEYIKNGAVDSIVKSIMNTELNMPIDEMRTDVVDCCLDILDELNGEKK